MSVAASDDVDVTSTSTATDPSEQDQNTDDKSAPSPRVPSPNASRGPVLLLRRQPATPATPSFRQVTSTPDVRQPSPARVENAMHTLVKETVDPSLLEAFANPMNRQYLLQLEGSLNSFVTQSRYFLDGFLMAGWIQWSCPLRILFLGVWHIKWRIIIDFNMSLIPDMWSSSDLLTPECIPIVNLLMSSPETRLSELSKTIRTPGSSTSSTALSEEGPQASTPEIKQIMKRVPGKSTRDEDDAKSESSQSQVLTREERQAVYEKTRARIFSDYVTQGLEPEKESDAGSESKTRIMISADLSFFNAS